MSAQKTMLTHVDHYFGGHAELLNMHERLADLLLLAQGLSSQDDAGEALQCCMSWVYLLCASYVLAQGLSSQDEAGEALQCGNRFSKVSV